MSSKATGALHWWPERPSKNNLQHKQTQSWKTSKTVVLGMLTLMDANSFVCACGILGLVDPEQKKGNVKLLLKSILKQFNSEDAKSSDDGGSSWYTKLYDHLE